MGNLYCIPKIFYASYTNQIGMIAFVRSNAIFTLDGHSRNNNLDYFTLHKEEDDWKILNGSNVSVRIKKLTYKTAANIV